MTTTAAIGAYDDARVFPLVREHMKARIPLTEEESERMLSNRLFAIVREVAPESFQEWVNQANLWATQGELKFN
jgi:hypothetical protein